MPDPAAPADPSRAADAAVALRLEAFLPYRLNVLAEIVSQSLAKLYEDRYGLAIPEWRVVATLGQYARMTAKEIGRHSRMHKTKVSRAVAGLEARGLLAREPNTEDLREAFLQLTPAGRAIYEDLAPNALRFADRLVESLEPEDRAALDRILVLLARRSEHLASEVEAGRFP